MIGRMRSGAQPFVVVVLVAMAGAAVLFRERISERRSSVPPAETEAALAVQGEPASSGERRGEPARPSLSAAPSASSADLARTRESRSTDADMGGACPRDMLLVDGSHCFALAHFCEEWVGADPTAVGPLRPPKRCRRFKERFVCEGDPVRLHFCIDRFEYPNVVGVAPALRASYRDAERACAVEGKRLCEADEWTLACEGPKAWPFPGGLARDPAACNIDRPLQLVNPDALARAADVSMEVERLDGRRPSDTSSACVSPYGVFDMVGNVAEWVHDRRGKRGAPTSDMALAGGAWEAAAATCRDHEQRRDEGHRSLMAGFRCCADARDGTKARRRGPPTRGRRHTVMP